MRKVINVRRIENGKFQNESPWTVLDQKARRFTNFRMEFFDRSPHVRQMRKRNVVRLTNFFASEN